MQKLNKFGIPLNKCFTEYSRYKPIPSVPKLKDIIDPKAKKIDALEASMMSNYESLSSRNHQKNLSLDLSALNIINLVEPSSPVKFENKKNRFNAYQPEDEEKSEC